MMRFGEKNDYILYRVPKQRRFIRYQNVKRRCFGALVRSGQ
jgi:hypothetical protein